MISFSSSVKFESRFFKIDLHIIIAIKIFIIISNLEFYYNLTFKPFIILKIKVVNLKIIDAIKIIVKNRKNKIAIGIGANEQYIGRINEVIKIIKKSGEVEILLVCDNKLKNLKNQFNERNQIIWDNKPAQKLIKMLLKGQIDGIVRGTIGSSPFLREIKESFHTNRLSRIALLEDVKGRDFLFVPVGIDEAKSVEEKLFFIRTGYDLLEKLGIKPKVAILSGGRASDFGRDELVDKSIKEAETIVNTLNKARFENIFHSEILIENAIEKANFIIAPDGISGNLIYRTLVHLGAGLSYGALYLEPYQNKQIIIDTSRVGPVNEYVGAVMLASGFKNLSSKY
jgi:putative methanogen marker protein 4